MKYKKKVHEIDWLTRGSLTDFGWGNGYVGVPKGHPWYDVDYCDIDCEVHGGLTYGQFQDKVKNVFWVGFDTAHLGDSLAQWPKHRVEAETQKLLEQAIAAGEK